MEKKVILISGGTDGLGRAPAIALAKKHHVVAFGLESDRVRTEFSTLGIDLHEVDVRKVEDIQQVVQKTMEAYGRIDVLVNSAGVLVHGLLESNSVEDIRNVFETNTLGTIFMCREVLPHMKRAKRGRIINIVSRGSYGLKERSVYAASKRAICGFNESLRYELDGHGIGVTGIFPGRMKTNIFSKGKVETDLSQALEVSEAVRLITFAIESPSDIGYPELGIRRLPDVEDE